MNRCYASCFDFKIEQGVNALGGSTLIFTYIRRLEQFLVVKF